MYISTSMCINYNYLVYIAFIFKVHIMNVLSINTSVFPSVSYASKISNTLSSLLF